MRTLTVPCYGNPKIRNFRAFRVTVEVMLRPTVSRTVYLGFKPHLGPKTRFLLLSDSCGFVVVGHCLWREDGSVVYNCWWPSPAQSFSSPSHAGLMTVCYCHRFETPPTWRARSPYLYPTWTGWPSYTPRHWVPFSPPPTTRRATVEVFEPASTRGLSTHRYKAVHREEGKTNALIAEVLFDSVNCLVEKY
jgi:hypothetical protein